MAETKRTEFQAERDRLEIARMYLRGLPQQEITDYLNKEYYSADPLSRQQISYDIRLIIERWVKASINHIDQRKAIELAKIDQLEITYWDAWERSQQPLKSKVIEGRGTTEEGKTVKQTVKTEERVGDPRFLDGVMKCIERRCAILGIDAPRREDITTGGEKIKTTITIKGVDYRTSITNLAPGPMGDSEPSGESQGS